MGGVVCSVYHYDCVRVRVCVCHSYSDSCPLAFREMLIHVSASSPDAVALILAVSLDAALRCEMGALYYKLVPGASMIRVALADRG
jgi:hypothetical protein